MPKLSAALGRARIWVKRDDLTGLAFGGSKTRSLNTLMAQAVAKGADTIITCGPTTSNHVRLTAAAANRLGLSCKLVLCASGHDHPTKSAQGNMLLNRMLGAEIILSDSPSLADLDTLMRKIADQVTISGRIPFIIPGGGYSPTGAAGYVGLIDELIDQSTNRAFKIDALIFASGSGCIQSGLILGNEIRQAGIRVIGLTINRTITELEDRIRHDVKEAAKSIEFQIDDFTSSIEVRDDYLGDGYAMPSEAGLHAIRRIAVEEGLLLDPCYTGKAMAGAIDIVSKEFEKDNNVVFIHTGGTPGIFRYYDELT